MADASRDLSSSPALSPLPSLSRQRIWCVKTALRPACPTTLDPPSAEIRPSSGTRLAHGQITARTTKLFVSFFHVSGTKSQSEGRDSRLCLYQTIGKPPVREEGGEGERLLLPTPFSPFSWSLGCVS